MGAGFMKFGATLHGSNVKTREAFSKLDIAGYNYGVKRYCRDLRIYPNRVILGSETFADDAGKFYDLAAICPALIGDFQWTGIDYLGEVGLGAWEYSEYAPNFEHDAGWLTSGCASLDILGTPNGMMAYTQVAFRQSPIRIGVVPVKFAKQKHSAAAWRFTNAMESWSWNGCDGLRTTVEVYAQGSEVELLLNGTPAGRKKLHKNHRVSFPVTYHSGTLTAIARDSQGKELSRTSLTTAGEHTQLTLQPEKKKVAQGELLYVRLSYTDEEGHVKPLVRGDIQVTVEGGKLIALGNACSYNARGYLTDTTDTYYGEAMAVIFPTDDVTVTAVSKIGTASVTVPYKA